MTNMSIIFVFIHIEGNPPGILDVIFDKIEENQSVFLVFF